jgi:hypothetical protein
MSCQCVCTFLIWTCSPSLTEHSAQMLVRPWISGVYHPHLLNDPRAFLLRRFPRRLVSIPIIELNSFLLINRLDTGPSIPPFVGYFRMKCFTLTLNFYPSS